MECFVLRQDPAARDGPLDTNPPVRTIALIDVAPGKRGELPATQTGIDAEHHDRVLGRQSEFEQTCDLCRLEVPGLGLPTRQALHICQGIVSEIPLRGLAGPLEDDGQQIHEVVEGLRGKIALSNFVCLCASPFCQLACSQLVAAHGPEGGFEVFADHRSVAVRGRRFERPHLDAGFDDKVIPGREDLCHGQGPYRLKGAVVYTPHLGIEIVFSIFAADESALPLLLAAGPPDAGIAHTTDTGSLHNRAFHRVLAFCERRAFA